MAITYKENNELREFLDLLAYSAIKSFYPTAIVKKVNITLEEAYNYLLKLCESGELKLVFEVRCPQESESICARKVDVVNNYNDALGKEYYCDICGNEFIAAKNQIFPAFEITTDYREFIRQKYKKKLNRLRITIP